MKSASRGATMGTARIEEDVVGTATGCRVITKFPANELLVCGADAADLEDARRVA